MRRWPVCLLGLVLVACGGTTAPAVPTATPLGPLTAREATATPAPAATAAPPTAPTGPTRTPTAPPAATAAPAPATTPAATRAATNPPATALGPVAVPQPAGPLPPGWQVYRGPPVFPFVIAYPPDWTVNDSALPGQRVVYFYGPDGRGAVERIDIDIGQTQTGANIDVQRDAFFYRKSAFCDRKGIEFTEHRPVGGATFAVLGATCDASNELSFMLVASGLKGGDEWNVLMRTPYARKEARLREVFEPMLASLTIYARVP